MQKVTTKRSKNILIQSCAIKYFFFTIWLQRFILILWLNLCQFTYSLDYCYCIHIWIKKLYVLIYWCLHFNNSSMILLFTNWWYGPKWGQDSLIFVARCIVSHQAVQPSWQSQCYFLTHGTFCNQNLAGWM